MSADAAPARVWLDVPFGQKDEAKAAGARWDPAGKRWFAPRPGMTALAQWAPLAELLPGEDRQFGSGLFVDLIPASCWFTNVRSCIAAEDWDRVRRMVHARAGQRCEACGAPADRPAQVWLEAHERWDYDTAHGVQRLRRLVCLCTSCHEATHFGRATVYGHADRAFTHLASVNHWTDDVARRHIDVALHEWTRRNTHDRTLDLSMLTAAGITLVEPPAAEHRRIIAEETLHAQTTDPEPSTPEPVTPGPSWFPDPTGRFEHRWWTGQAWTGDVATRGVAGFDPL